jgi:hypothetical protein
VLVLVIGIWAAAGGVAEIINGFRTGETAGARPLYILTGLVTVAFGAVLFTRPGIGAITLALLFGLLSLIYGLSRITLGCSGTKRFASRLRGLSLRATCRLQRSRRDVPQRGIDRTLPGRAGANTCARLPVITDAACSSLAGCRRRRHKQRVFPDAAGRCRCLGSECRTL